VLNAPRADAHAAGFSQSVRAAVCGMAPPPQTAEEHLALVKEITGPYPKTIWQGLGNQYIEIYQCVWCFSKLITPICKGGGNADFARKCGWAKSASSTWAKSTMCLQCFRVWPDH